MRLASLGMYDMAEVQPANDALWRAIAARLGEAGFADVPAALERGRTLEEIWLDPELLLAQTCGYPLVTLLAGRVRLVATPRYRWPGCEGAWHRSLLVVGRDAPFKSLADLAGRRVAFNSRGSNSGMNLLRAAAAPLARDGRFFGELVETGGHLLSMAAVAEGRADVAAIDCVTFGLARLHRPRLTIGLRVLGQTAATPALPFVTRLEASDAEVAALATAIEEALSDPATAEAREMLGIDGIERLPLAAYEVVAALEREAVAAGYPELA